jgi:hypothetical protein
MAMDLNGSIGLLPARRHGLGRRLLPGAAEQLLLGSRVDLGFATQRIQVEIFQQRAYRLGNLFLKFFLPVISTARSGSRT